MASVGESLGSKVSRGEGIVCGVARRPRGRVSDTVARATTASAIHVDVSILGRLKIQREDRMTQPCKDRQSFQGGRRSVHMWKQDMARFSCNCKSESKADILQTLRFMAKTVVCSDV